MFNSLQLLRINSLFGRQSIRGVYYGETVGRYEREVSTKLPM